MTQINRITQTQQSQQAQQAQSKSGPASTAFDTLLTSALDSTDPAETDTALSGLEEIAAAAFTLQTPSDTVFGKTDQLLDLLNQYADQLSNPAVSLKALGPMLEQLNKEAGSLIQASKLLGPQEGGLKDIATQTALAAQTEYVKFQRGDYLS